MEKITNYWHFEKVTQRWVVLNFPLTSALISNFTLSLHNSLSMILRNKKQTLRVKSSQNKTVVLSAFILGSEKVLLDGKLNHYIPQIPSLYHFTCIL